MVTNNKPVRPLAERQYDTAAAVLNQYEISMILQSSIIILQISIILNQYCKIFTLLTPAKIILNLYCQGSGVQLQALHSKLVHKDHVTLLGQSKFGTRHCQLKFLRS